MMKALEEDLELQPPLAATELSVIDTTGGEHCVVSMSPNSLTVPVVQQQQPPQQLQQHEDRGSSELDRRSSGQSSFVNKDRSLLGGVVVGRRSRRAKFSFGDLTDTSGWFHWPCGMTNFHCSLIIGIAGFVVFWVLLLLRIYLPDEYFE